MIRKYFLVYNRVMNIESTDNVCACSKDKRATGTIFDIKRFAINDGPGIRTTVFLKGCPLRCQWCHNPESISRKPQLTFRSGFCIQCGSCMNICPNNAIRMEQSERKISIEPGLCRDNGSCTDICPTDALTLTGRTISPAEVLTEVMKDIIFYEQSDGGVTFSGGEPLAQADFLCECLELCKAKNIHSTIDTSCYAKQETVKKVARIADLFLCDIKHMDSELHKKYTGVDNKLILKNISLLSELGKQIIIRVPLIPGINDFQENLEETQAFAAKLKNIVNIDFLPYNSGGNEKKKILISMPKK